MSVPFLTAEALSAHASIKHAFFTREGGVSTGLYSSLNGGLGSLDDRGNVLENRRRMAETFGVSLENLVTPFQVHSPDAIAVDAPFKGEPPHGDALVTSTPGLMVAVNVADCGPVLFADPKAGVVGAAHAGWKGAVGGVLENTLDAMESLGAQRHDIIAVLGPCIRQPSYEVGPDFVENVLAINDSYSRFFVPSEKSGHVFFDLAGCIAARFEAADIHQFYDLNYDTYTNEQQFFSFRRTTHRNEPDYGRQIAAICLAAPAG